MDELRKGKSTVVETNHVLVLGWSDKLIGIMVEICSACETMPDGTEGSCIVILNDTLEKTEMEEILLDRLPDDIAKKSYFVVRYGSPMVSADLAKVAVNDARCIIVLCDSMGEAERVDAGV